MNKNGFTSKIIILIIIVLGFVGYLAYQKFFSGRNNTVFIYKASNGSDNQPTDSYFKSNLDTKDEIDISSYFKDYPSISVSPNGKYITRQNNKVLEIALSKDLSFKQAFLVTNENGEIGYPPLWSSDSTSVAILVVNGRDNAGLLGNVPKTLYLINVNTLESKKLHTFEKGSDMWLETFDSDAHKLHIVEVPPSSGVIIPGTERYSSVDTITGKINFEEVLDITNKIERENKHKYFVSNEKILYDLDLSLNTTKIIFDAKDGYLSEIKYLPPKNRQFVFTDQKSNNKTVKFTLYLYDIDTQKLSVLVEDLNGKIYMQPSLDGRYIWIRPSAVDDKGTYKVFDMITKKLTTFTSQKDKYKFYDFYWISE